MGFFFQAKRKHVKISWIQTEDQTLRQRLKIIAAAVSAAAFWSSTLGPRASWISWT